MSAIAGFLPTETDTTYTDEMFEPDTQYVYRIKANGKKDTKWTA